MAWADQHICSYLMLWIVGLPTWNMGGGQIDVVYTDFEKAFDKVPHRRLISKLESYGINTAIINWIRNFFKARKFKS